MITAWVALLVMMVNLLPVPAVFPGWHHSISTTSALTQYYFDRGLLQAYGFNHAAALRSFQTATKFDPNCALCYWGMAYVLGPNINTEMSADTVPRAWEAIQQALALQDHASAPEQAYIQALATRYRPTPVADRSALNLAYSEAMGQVVQRYPDDLDAVTLYAEALMDTTPWKYWQENGQPNPTGQRIITLLNAVLQQAPEHIGALHFYIHAVEEKHPELAMAVADRLRDLHLPIGHLVHMPSHIYLRVGRYRDAVSSNRRAIAVDRQTLGEDGIYRYAYIPHNQHFLWYAATLAGQQQIALQAATETAQLVDPQLLRQPGYGTLQHYLSLPLYAWVKFELWDKILHEPAPAADLIYPRGVWHYARGMAWVHQGDSDRAATELAHLRAIATSPGLDGVTLWDVNSTADLLQIGAEVLGAELSARQGQIDQAIQGFSRAIDREDHLTYDEPAPWPAPVRQSLGDFLLNQNRPAEAAQLFREDLEIYPANVWSLRGLAASEKALNRLQQLAQSTGVPAVEAVPVRQPGNLPQDQRKQL